MTDYPSEHRQDCGCDTCSKRLRKFKMIGILIEESLSYKEHVSYDRLDAIADWLRRT